MYIESQQNTRYKGWKKLLTKKGRTQQQMFMVEGFHLAEEALRAHWSVEAVLLAENTVIPADLDSLLHTYRQQTYTLNTKLFSELSETQAPQGIIVIVHKSSAAAAEYQKLVEQGQFLLLVDQVQDPGNLGTIIRTADAAGIDGLILGKGTTDLYAGKTIRSTQGSIFHVPTMEDDLEQTINRLKEHNWLILATSLADSRDYKEVETQDRKIALIVGNEGQGIAPAILQQADHRIRIPIWGQAESLNVGVATGILLYHYKK